LLTSAEFGLIFAVAMATAALAFLYVGKLRPAQPSSDEADREEPLALLFEDGALHHANDPAMTRLALMPGTHFWEDLRDSLITRFPDFPCSPCTGKQGSLTLWANDGTAPDQVQMHWRGPLCWVTLDNSQTEKDRIHSAIDAKEVDALRRSSDTSPHPIWHQDDKGNLIWSNPAYDALFGLNGNRDQQTGKPLFPASQKGGQGRVSFQRDSGSKPSWFEVTSLTLEGITIHHATCINALVDAEDAQRNFVQTLAKTFAHLSIGLAIFDRNGQLALFNPALLDLTGLPAEFLSARPKMLSFFDQLRENRRMPEPKNYRNWRQEISEVISAATDGHYRETWSLEDGRTYSVQGRPHPDGATAFLIEDISAEVSLTRNFRAELELSQSLLDTVNDGLVVFSASGVLTFCNTVYKKLWQQNPDAAFADVTISDCVDVWRGQAQADVPWQNFLSYFGDYETNPTLEAKLCFDTGAVMCCTAERIGSGATLIRFKQHQNDAILIG
jgi:PAS domain-containing protein